MEIYGTSMPDVLVEPLTTEEVAAVMKICNDNKIPVTPSGPAQRSMATGKHPRRRYDLAVQDEQDPRL